MKKLPFLFVVLLISTSSFNIHAQSDYMSERWQHNELGINLGVGCLYSLDLDNDGNEEILVISDLLGDSFFSILELENGEFKTKWTSEIYEFYFNPALLSVKPYDLNNDSIYEIYTLFQDGKVECYDALTMKTVFVFQAEVPFINDFQIADIDNDTEYELIISGYNYSDGENTYIYDLLSQELEWSTDVHGSRRFEIGDVDGDSVREIVLQDGNIIDGITHTVDWYYPGEFGRDFKLGDIDDDNILEIVTADNDGIKTYDAKEQSLLWTIDPGYIAFGGLFVGDLLGDETPEIIYGSSFQGLKCYWAKTQLKIWETDYHETGITTIVSGDPDNDGTKDILWGNGSGSSGPDHLMVNKAATGDLKWKSWDTKGWFTFDIADIEKNGQKELAVSYYKRGEYLVGGGIYIFDARSKALQMIIDSLSQISEIRCFKIANINQTEQDEIIIGFADGYGYESIIILDGLTYEQLYRDRTFGIISSIEVADIDEDGTTEILFGNNASKIRIMNGDTFETEWLINEGCWYLCYVQQILIQDIDNDPALEIIFWFVNGDKVFVYDALTREQEYVSSEFRDMSALEIGDITGDEHPEFLIGDEAGDLTILDFVHDSVIDKIYLLNEELAGLKLLNIDNKEGDELICGGGKLRVFSPDDFDLIWESRAFLQDDHRAYVVQQIDTFNLDNDAYPEILWSNRRGVFQFECVGYPVDNTLRFVNPDAKWYVAKTYPAATPEFPSFVETTTLVYGYDGDTIVNGDTLAKFYAAHDSLFDSGKEYVGAILERGAFVSILDKNGILDTLYNFNLIEGDSIRYDFVLGYDYLHVVSIDSIEIDDLYHKRINFSKFEMPPLFLNETWIEGIGSIHGPLFPGSPKLFSDEIPDSTLLTCYALNDTLVWHHPAYEACYTEIVLGSPELTYNDLKVYPNPTTRWINIAPAVQTPYSVSLTDYYGRILFIDNNINRIDLARFPGGIYILKVETQDGLLIIEKVIKQ